MRETLLFLCSPQVTIFGQSAGSWSVMHQLLSLQAEGLFRGAIGQSGTPVGHLNNQARTGEQALAKDAV